MTDPGKRQFISVIELCSMLLVAFVVVGEGGGGPRGEFRERA
jgi:hypothetical protein